MQGLLQTASFAVFLNFMLGAFLPLPVHAQAQVTSSSSMAEQAQQTPAGKFVQDLGNNAIALIANKSLTQEQRTNQYHAILHDAFDLKTIGRFVIGRAWNTATPEQQQEYMKLFEQIVIKTYGDRLNFYSGQTFRVNAVRQESDKDAIVSSEIDHPDGSPPIAVDWRVRQNDGKYAIIDVMIAGVSQSVTQRQEYAAVIQRDGGKIDGLLELMRQRAQGAS